MTETLDTANEIKTIRYKIDSIEGTLRLMLRKDAAPLMEIILELFKKDAILAPIYDALDGDRAQKEVADFVQANGTPCNEMAVSRKVSVLEEAGLIEKTPKTKSGGIVWVKTPSVERVLRLTKKLKKAGLL